MPQIVNRAKLEFDGQSITSFSAFYEGEEVYAEQVELMYGTGYADKTVRYTFGLDYRLPTSGMEVDLKSVRDGRFTVQFDGGQRNTYTGVRCLRKGESTVEGANGMTRRYDFGAENMTEES